MTPSMLKAAPPRVGLNSSKYLSWYVIRIACFTASTSDFLAMRKVTSKSSFAHFAIQALISKPFVPVAFENASQISTGT